MVIMNLSAVYLRQREEWKQEGLQEGMQRELRLMIENILRVRFGAIDEQLNSLVEPLLKLKEEEIAQLLLTLSREELLSRFGGEEESERDN